MSTDEEAQSWMKSFNEFKVRNQFECPICYLQFSEDSNVNGVISGCRSKECTYCAGKSMNEEERIERILEILSATNMARWPNILRLIYKSLKK